MIVKAHDAVKAIAPEELDEALLAASQILFNLTGARWSGIVDDRYRPNPGRGQCGCSIGRPGCQRVTEFVLTGYPVITVTEVLMDGVAVPDTFYRVDDWRWLVFIPDEDDPGGQDPWPCCQRMERPPTEEDTFEVAYRWGEVPDTVGVRSAATLGLELAKAACPATAGSCRLPGPTTTAISRQGVSKVISSTLFREGWTGLAEIDLWLASLPKAEAQGGGRVIDPYALGQAGRRSRRHTWLPGS